MGVPGLEPFVCSKSISSVSEIIQGERLDREVDYFYADSNGILHSICQRIFNYGEKKATINFYEGVSYQKKIKAVYEEYFSQLVNITKIVKPKKVLYIAIDGPAPLAKQNQQRQRRFGRASSSDAKEFDTCCITPGTQFMHDLTVFIRDAIHLAVSSKKHYTVPIKVSKTVESFVGVWQGIEVIFSPPTVAGEGEHKLMEYLRGLPNTEKEESTHCFFGPDGDLIMLGLTSTLPKVSLLRQDVFRPGIYKLIDIGFGFSNTLVSMLKKPCHSSPQQIKDDFVMAGMMVGNDFLPRLQMFITVRDGLEYISHITKKFHSPLTIDGHVHTSGLKEFITFLAQDEPAKLKDQIFTEDKRRLPPDDVKYLNTLILKNIDDKLHFSFDNYRQDYNNKHFPNEDVGMVCYDYLKTLVWVFEYYRNGLVDWDWAYRHHYPPLMTDFANFLENNVGEGKLDFNFELGNPTFPFEQLLGVLPPTSAALLPEPYSQILEAQTLPHISIDYEGKTREHEAVILLPFSDYENVRKVYLATKKGIRKFNRDTFGHPIRYITKDNEVKMRWLK